MERTIHEMTGSLVLSVCLVVFTVLSVKRLYFHELSRVPGPKWAALSSFYEFYHNCWRRGKFSFKIAELHQIYGPVVRIGPGEVHIDDPTCFDELYNVVGKLEKDRWYYSFAGTPDAMFGTVDVERHRQRRKAMANFFATSNLAQLEQTALLNVTLLKERLNEFRDSRKPVNISNASRCLAADSVTGFCMPQSFHFLESVDFADDYNKQARGLSWLAVWNRHVPFILAIFTRMPRWLVKLAATEGGLMTFDFQNDLARQAHRAVHTKPRSDNSVLEGIVNSDLPETEKTVDRITQEARQLVGAGTETTGNTIDTVIYYVLTHPDVRQRLNLELADLVRTQGTSALSSYNTLRQLPYLTAVLNEGMRLSNSVSGRMPRVDPKHTHTIGAHKLPRGTVMSMTLSSLHMNPDAFPEPHRFSPDRWLATHSTRHQLRHMEQNFAPFSRGARSCIGRDLALMNTYLVLAMFFGEFDQGKWRVELFETTDFDLRMEHDFFAPFPHVNSRGLRVMLT